MAENTYPEIKFSVPAYLKYGSVNRDATNPINLFLADAIDIDFRVQGTINSGVTAEKIAGYKYIVGDKPIVGENQDLLTRSGVTSGDLNVGDIIVYNPTLFKADGTVEREERFERLFNSKNPGFGLSGGAIAYVIDEQSFKGYNGSQWEPLGGGVTGGTGATGEVAVYGRSYTQQSSFDPTYVQGQVRIDNNLSDGTRDIKIHKLGTGAPSDLIPVFFPNGTDSANDATNPKVSIFFYNKNNRKTFGARIQAKSTANSSSNELNFTNSANFTSYEILVSESGAGEWSGDDRWENDDEIYVLAVADGSAGATGAVGATGQGITFAGVSADAGGRDELFLNYLDADGNVDGASFGTGIKSGIDGVTGNMGEVGLYMFFTGGTEKWEDQSGSAYSVITDMVSGQGEMLYSKDTVITQLNGITQDCIISDIRDYSLGSDFIWNSFGLKFEDIVGTGKAANKFTNIPGKLYFYTDESDYEIKLRSFVSYDKVAFVNTGSDSSVVLAGVSYGTFAGGKLLGPSAVTQEAGYMLPVPRGIRGTGITFGEIVGDTLFLDYIDEDGNTFGRFSTISGITGQQGDMNPFNVPYSITADSVNYSGLTGFVSVSARDGDAPTKVKISSTSSSADDVFKYISLTTEETQTKSGFITFFSNTDATDFGLYRYTNAVAGSSTEGVEFQDLVHAGGNNTLIRGDGAAGFTLGEAIKFAVNLDGKRGFSGEIVGYTFGIEYFSQAARPVVRSNNDPLEIGDKWFSHTTGLEFTFLGSSGDTDNVVGHGTSADPVWVQTNNARSGARGPQGPRGERGLDGPAGITGLNPETNSWTNRAYDYRDAVYVTYEQCVAALDDPDYGTINKTVLLNNINANWGELAKVGAAPGDGPTAGYFVCLGINSNNSSIPANDPLNIPGTHSQITSGLGFNATQNGFAPVVVNRDGPIGITGAGVTGQSVVGAGLDGNTLQLTLRSFSDESPEGTDDIIDVGEVIGPEGPTGPIGGDIGNYVFNEDGEQADGTNNLTSVVSGEPDLLGQVRLRNYAEVITEGDHPNEATGVWTIQCGPAVIQQKSSTLHVQLPSNPTVDTIQQVILENLYNEGGATTILLQGPDTANTGWEFGSGGNAANVNFDYEESGGSSPSKVFISVQNETTTNPTEIDLPKNSNEYGIMTFRRNTVTQGGGDMLYINYVKYVTP